KLKDTLPHAYAELENIRKLLESHFKDMQDFEFTIEEGEVYMLQTRNGKRTGLAAVRIACEMVKETLNHWEPAVMRVAAGPLDALVARELGKVCVCGASALHVDYPAKTLTVDGQIFREGEHLSIDGTSGEVYAGQVKTAASEVIQVLLEKSLPSQQSQIYQN